jgi:poly-beta-1,6-N-acetyl-D-glucosamine biosynthesis protein PgaD
MDKSRQRNSQNHLNQSFIIRSKRIWWRELVVGLFTLLVWLYCLTVIYFFIDAIFSLHHEYPLLFRIVFKMTDMDIKDYLKLGGILFIMIYLVLSGWSYYNRKRYGNLTRRKYPSPTTKEDLMNLNMIDEITYEELQNEKVIIFETNPIGDKGEQYETSK